jgi:acyl transferase domain-containing protein/acyl carrier protein
MLLRKNSDENTIVVELDKLTSVFGGEGNVESRNDIAVIGMSIKAPGSKNIQEFWENLRNGKESITHFSQEELLSFGISENELSNKDYVRANSYIKDKECFDSNFFGYLPDEAKLMDPQTRVFHEVVWSALEDAGYDPLSYKGLIGLYAGAGSNLEWEAYSQLSNEGKIDGFTARNLSNKEFMNALIAHKLNLKGPVNSINTACSTSLVAIHYAVRSILMGENHIAIAGGVSINKRKEEGYLYQEGMIHSKDGHNRTFDSGSNGTVGGEGAGAIVLKRLSAAIEDGDQIYAVIKGSAINNDGNRKIGFTAPSVAGQSEVIRLAHKVANVSPESISYVESHGTATKLGDPIEVLALTQSFGMSADKYCALGSVKTNIGHLDSAAGVAGFIKAVLCLKNKELVPSLHFKTPNPEINFKESPFYVNTELKEWLREVFPRRAGVSSFGIGGTNAHVILEEAPKLEGTTPGKKAQVITLSAKTPEALERNQTNLKTFLSENKTLNIGDLSWTFQIGRSGFSYRSSFIAEDIEGAIKILEGNNKNYIHSGIVNEGKRKLAFMFSGQGSQYENMGRGLYEVEESVFRKTMDHCFEITGRLIKTDLKTILYPGEPNKKQPINETINTQPILFIFEYSLAKQLESYGIVPDIMIGHSLGEYVAACLSEVITLEDTLRLVIKRGELIQSLEKGSMLNVGLAPEAVAPYLSKNLSIAAINTQQSTIISGNEKEINVLLDVLNLKGIAYQKLHTSHAFHSGMMDPILEEFSRLVSEVTIKAPKIPYISNVTGEEITHGELKQSNYWSNHIRATVNFSQGLEKIISTGNIVLIEVGPGKILCNLVHQQKTSGKTHTAVNLVRHPHEQKSDQVNLLESLASLWSQGVSINWKSLRQGEVRRKISMPTYSFEKIKYPLAKGVYELISKAISKKNYQKRENIIDWFYELSWKRSRLIPPTKEIHNVTNYLVFSDTCDIAVGLIDVIKEKSGSKINVVQVSRAEHFEQTSEFEFRLNPKDPESYVKLFKKLDANQILPDKIIHLWNVSNETESLGLLTFQSTIDDLEVGYYSLLNIAKSIGIVCPFRQVTIDVITNLVSCVNSGDFSIPSRATILGPILTIPKEYRNILCRHVDLKTGDRRDLLLTNLFAEISSGYESSSISFRQGDRWAQIYEPIKLETCNRVQTKLKNGGVYLITGGMGGMGLVFSKFLSKEFNAKLILTGRKIKSQVIASELKNIGQEVIYLDVDVSDPNQMERKITEAETLFGKIDGIIHTAGIGDYSGIIQNRTREQCEEVFASKIFGTIVLNELAKKREIDLLVLCSSAAAAVAPFGQVAYTAANIFQDNFAQSIKNNVMQSIGWDTWYETGMAVNSLADRSVEQKEIQLAHGLSNAEGVEVLKRVLGHDIPGLVVFTRDVEALLMENEPRLNSESEESKIVQSRPLLSNVYKMYVSVTEKALCIIFEDFFGIKEIGINDDFFELGMDSLKAITLIGRIHQKLNIELRINDVLEHSNISDLGKKIDSLKNIGQMRKDSADMHFEHEIEI